MVNARVWTGDPDSPWAEALAVRGDTITAVGTTEAIRAKAGPGTRVIDAAGRMVTPGFIDSHAHFLTGGFALASVQLRDAASPEESVARITAYARTVPPRTWIRNGDWDHERNSSTARSRRRCWSRSLGVIAGMQPYHAIDDGRWAERVIGPVRAEGTYAFRSLLDAGATLAFGSDWFVAPPTPLEGIAGAVTHHTLDGAHPDGGVPSQKISLDEALRGYTTGAAFAGFAEGRVGVLRPGALADFVVPGRDLSAIPAGEIADTPVVLTLVGGRVVRDARQP